MLYSVLLEIQQALQQYNNFEDRLRFDEIIVTSAWRVLWDTV